MGLHDLWSHQKRMVDQAIDAKQAFWDAACGVGKTRAALATVDTRLRHGLILVITIKKALVSVWQKEIKALLPDAECLVLNKGNSKRKTVDMLKFAADYKREQKKHWFVVVNYETAKLIPLEAVDWDFAIADESHKLKSYNSKTSTTLAKSCYNIPFKIAMTGTPYEDRPLDAFGQARWLRPEQRVTLDSRGRRRTAYISRDFGAYPEFFETYAVYYRRDNIPIITGYKNTEQLANILKPFSIRIRKEDANELPPLTTIVRGFDLTPAHRSAYDELWETMTVEIDGKRVMTDNILTQALRLHQLTGGFYQPYDIRQEVQQLSGEITKLEELLELADEIGGAPFVVYTRFTPEVYMIKKALAKQGITSLQVADGKDQHIDWQQGGAQALICNMGAGSAAISLTRATYMIYYSFGYSAVDYKQSLDRVHRPPQTLPSTAYILLANKTVDWDIYKTLNSKGETSQTLKEFMYGTQNIEPFSNQPASRSRSRRTRFGQGRSQQPA